MKLSRLLDYNVLLHESQYYCDFWVDSDNQILGINHEHSHYSYLSQVILKENAKFEWPYNNNWVKLNITKNNIIISGTRSRIKETKNYWVQVLRDKKIILIEEFCLEEQKIISSLFKFPKDIKLLLEHLG